MNDRRLSDAQIAAALRARLPAQAQAGLPGRVMDAVEITSQRRPLPSFLGALSDADPVAVRRSLLIAAAVLLGLALASAAAVGAWRLLQRDPGPKLDLTPPADLPAFVLSTYDRMPEMPPVAITTLTDGSVKGRLYVDRSGAVRFEHYATPDAPTPDTYEILNGTTMGQLAIVGSTKEWVQQDGAISEDPRVFLLAKMEGFGAGFQPGCGVTRNQGEVGDGTAASGWRYVGVESVVGRPTFHVACAGGDLWIDVETRLVLRSRGPVHNADGTIPGTFRTIEVTDIEFGEQPAGLFAIAPPAGVASVSSAAYQCQVAPIACSTPSPTQPKYTPPPGAIQGPLPPLPPSRAKNGWIAEIGVGLASAHLQVLRRAGLIVARRDGTRIFYRLAGDDAYHLLVAVRTFAADRLAEADRAARAYLGDTDPIELVSRKELLTRVKAGDAVVLDLRPAEEYRAGHIAGALSVPLEELEARLAELPAGIEIVAYCRGPFCALAPQGVALLQRHGLRARRLEDGFPEWRFAGLPVAIGPSPI